MKKLSIFILLFSTTLYCFAQKADTLIYSPKTAEFIPANTYSAKIFNKSEKRVTKGIITKLTDSTITIRSYQKKEQGSTLVFHYRNIDRIAIRREDNLKKKIIIGAVTGVAFGAVIGTAVIISPDYVSLIPDKAIVGLSTASGFLTGISIGTINALIRENYQIDKKESLFMNFYTSISKR